MHTEETYPGHNDDIKLAEFEKIKDKINEKYRTELSALDVRSEFEIAYNKLFDTMLNEHSEKIFDIIYLFMDVFNIDEIKAVRYLNKSNREIVRQFAINNYNTKYYENIERAQLKRKLEKKGRTFFDYLDIRELFE